MSIAKLYAYGSDSNVLSIYGWINGQNGLVAVYDLYKFVCAKVSDKGLVLCGLNGDILIECSSADASSVLDGICRAVEGHHKIIKENTEKLEREKRK